MGDWTTPTQAAVRSERYEAVKRTIEQMEPVDREILALRHFEELTNAEAAEELGIQPKAASIRYVRAMSSGSRRRREWVLVTKQYEELAVVCTHLGDESHAQDAAQRARQIRLDQGLAPDQRPGLQQGEDTPNTSPF